MRKTSGGGGEGMAVAEIQGLYGAFSFPEKLLQQIWLRGDFDARTLRAADGRLVEILHPGRWNLLAGPDFKGARLRIGNFATTGDIELHLHAADWRTHGHATDPAYANVILHAVLFPTADVFTAGAAGREIPLVTLLPLLHHDLEEYAAEAAVERLANHPLTRAREALASLGEAELRVALEKGAQERWRQKVHYAKIRIDRLGWEEACHHTALEILGYSANRAPMLSVATAFPLARWVEHATAHGAEHPELNIAAEILDRPNPAWRWQTQGVRPTNHPRTRLRQYARWTQAAPDWPQRLAGLASELRESCAASSRAEHGATTASFRRVSRMRALRERFAAEVCGNAVTGSRLDTIICDGLWPLMAANNAAYADSYAGCWHHWFAGDVPAKWGALLRGLHVIGGRGWPAAHGSLQGLLGWVIAEEKKQNSGDSAEGRGT